MLKLRFEVLTFRHIQGRKDPSRSYTIVEGIATLPDNTRSYCEAFLQDRKTFTPGPHVLVLSLRSDQNRRLMVSAQECYPEKAAA